MARRAIVPTGASCRCARPWPPTSRALARPVDTRPRTSPYEPGGKPVIGKFLLSAREPGRRGPLPEPGLPYLRVADRVPRRQWPCPTASSRADDDFPLDFDAIEAPSRRARERSFLTTCRTPRGPNALRPRWRPGRALPEARPRWCSATRLTSTSVTRANLSRSPRCPAWPSARDPLHVLQEVRHDRLAPGRRDRAREVIAVIATLNVNEESLPEPLRPVRRSGGPHGRPERSAAHRLGPA